MALRRAVSPPTMPVVAQFPEGPMDLGPGMRNITLAWDNLWWAPGMTNFVTGLEGSTNLSDWYLLREIPLRTNHIYMSFTNRPPYEFYRAYNREL